MIPDDLFKPEGIARVKNILLEHEQTPYPGRSMTKIQEQIGKMILGHNEDQWKALTPAWRNKVIVTVNKLISAAFKQMIRLDIGCGGRKKTGFIGVDILRTEGVDIVADLTKENLPFEDDKVDAVYSDHFLEHLTIEEITKVIEELHRVCRTDAIVEIRVPHFSGFTNFYEYHKTSFRYNSFAEFLWEEGMFLAPTKFSLVSRKIKLVNTQSPKNHRATKWFIWNRPMEWLVNKFPMVYETSAWRNFFPAWELIIKMRVVK